MVKVATWCWFMLLWPAAAWGQKKSVPPEVWLSLADVQNRQLVAPRPILVDVYTDWCVYCKAMDRQTWRNKNVQTYMESHFYPIKFNAEQKDTVHWEGKAYIYQPRYKVHMLASAWLQGNMVYPSTVVIPPAGEPIILTGYVSVSELEPVLKYFGEGHYRHTAWLEYKASYKPEWK